MSLHKKSLACLLMSVSMTGVVEASLYNVTAVLQGNDGNFSFSSFHDANDSTPMTGATLSSFLNSEFSGTYDDVTGMFDASFSIDNTAGPVHISGTLLFDGSGQLASNSELIVDFQGTPSGFLTDTTIGFLPGDICCSGSLDPNAFNGSMMSLWGANFDYGTGNDIFNGSYAGSTLGMDLRLELTAVPVPAAVWLFGSGLIGLAATARRRK